MPWIHSAHIARADIFWEEYHLIYDVPDIGLQICSDFSSVVSVTFWAMWDSGKGGAKICIELAEVKREACDHYSEFFYGVANMSMAHGLTLDLVLLIYKVNQ